MSLVLTAIAMLVASMLVAVGGYFMAHRPVVGVRCPECNYDLRGSRGSVCCPECGARNVFFFVPRAPFTIFKLQRLLGDLHDANVDAGRAET